MGRNGNGPGDGPLPTASALWLLLLPGASLATFCSVSRAWLLALWLLALCSACPTGAPSPAGPLSPMTPSLRVPSCSVARWACAAAQREVADAAAQREVADAAAQLVAAGAAARDGAAAAVEPRLPRRRARSARLAEGGETWPAAATSAGGRTVCRGRGATGGARRGGCQAGGVRRS
eukprot:scaffold21903_cov58-Phaeocystis_antarctica.AAC.2